MQAWIRDHGLALVLFALFAVFLIAQYHRLALAQRRPIGSRRADPFVRLVPDDWTLRRGDVRKLGERVLQMAAYVVLTIWLVQKGSSESKPPEGDEELDANPRMSHVPDVPGPVRRGGWRLKLYENSLGIAFAVLFLLSITLHALGSASEYNVDRSAHGDPPVNVGRFVTTSTFWFQSFQNWQSEFLAVGAIVTLSVFLRQRGSPESKPVAAPHSQTGN